MSCMLDFHIFTDKILFAASVFFIHAPSCSTWLWGVFYATVSKIHASLFYLRNLRASQIGIRYPHIGFIIEDVFITGNCMGQLPYYLFLSNLFLEWVLLGLLLMTRFIGLFLCVTDVVFTCCPGDQLCDGSWKFNISIFLNRVATYDWWTLKTLPEEFLALPLKKKTLRPFITPYSEPSYNYRVKPTSSVLLGKNLFKARR